MSDLKEQLTRLGSTHKELRPHIRAILARMDADGTRSLLKAFQNTLEGMENELARRPHRPLEYKHAMPYLEALVHHSKVLGAINRKLARNIRLTHKKMREYLAVHGVLDAQPLWEFIDELKATAKALSGTSRTASAMDLFGDARKLERKHLEAMRKDLVRLVGKAAGQLEKYGFEVTNQNVWVSTYERPQMEITFKSEPLDKRKVEGILVDILDYGGYVKAVKGGVEWSLFMDLDE